MTPPVDNGYERHQHETKVMRRDPDILAFWRILAIASSSSLVTILVFMFTLGRQVVTQPQMEDYVSKYSPYTQDKGALMEEEKEQDREIMALQMDLERMRNNQIRILAKLGMSYSDQ